MYYLIKTKTRFLVISMENLQTMYSAFPYTVIDYGTNKEELVSIAEMLENVYLLKGKE